MVSKLGQQITIEKSHDLTEVVRIVSNAARRTGREIDGTLKLSLNAFTNAKSLFLVSGEFVKRIQHSESPCAAVS